MTDHVSYYDHVVSGSSELSLHDIWNSVLTDTGYSNITSIKVGFGALVPGDEVTWGGVPVSNLGWLDIPNVNNGLEDLLGEGINAEVGSKLPHTEFKAFIFVFYTS